MELKHVKLDVKESIGIITLNMPQILNAFNMLIGNDLTAALKTCYSDDKLRAVILTGEGKAFCAGGDISEFRSTLHNDPSKPFRDLIPPFNKIIKMIRELPKPVICAVNGIASGGGMTLAAACDYRIAASSAKFKQAYTSIGLSGDGAWGLLVPLLIGYHRAAELILFDPLIDARTAQEWNLVNAVVDDADLMTKSMEIAYRLTAVATKAYGAAKGNLNHAMMEVLDGQLRFEMENMIRLSVSTGDYLKGIEAFITKKRPEYLGK